MNIKYLGHSAFEITTGSSKILIDPFLVMAPSYNYNGVSEIFVTHAHSDHLGNAIKISKETGAVVNAIFELANYCGKMGATANGIGLGSWQKRTWGKFIAVPALHSSSIDGIYGGNPCGYIFEIEGKYIYHAGDTSLNQEMKTIGELYAPNVAMLPIGGVYTMDVEHSVTASKWLNAQTIIPMHYNTFPAISADTKLFEEKIRELGKNAVVMSIYQDFQI